MLHIYSLKTVKSYSYSIIGIYDRSVVASLNGKKITNELIYHHYFHTDEELNEAISKFAYVLYNHVRPH